LIIIVSNLFFFIDIYAADIIEVEIKGFDDGIKTSKQRDYKEAVLFAKREAIEKAGVQIESGSKIENFILKEDYIESKAKAILLPGFRIIDVGYSEDGTYQIVLIGKISLKKINSQEYTSWMSYSLYQQEFNLQVDQKHYPKKVEGRCNSFSPQFRAHFVPYPSDKFTFYSYHNMNNSYFKKRDEDLTHKGYRIVCSQSFECNGKTYYQATWIRYY
jgi:hypothetical protein